jgi:transposase-like protein
MNEPKTLLEAIQYFSDYENCRKFMVSVRWMDEKVRCPHCGNEKVAYLEKAKLYFCPTKHPKQKFSLKVGTIFEDSPIALEKWLPAAWLIANCKNGISSYEMARAIGVTQKSAWFMLHRLGEAMRDEGTWKFGFGGPVESDETFLVPKKDRMNRKQREKYNRGKGEYRGVIWGTAAVHGILDRYSRQVRAKSIPNIKRDTLQNAILANVTPMAKVYTDESTSYMGLEKNYVHKIVNRSQEYVNGQVHTQGIENFWSLLKRTLRGTYVAVEPFHLDAYLDEQVFRYNNRFVLAMTRIAGRRLTYAELTGKEEVRAD